MKLIEWFKSKVGKKVVEGGVATIHVHVNDEHHAALLFAKQSKYGCTYDSHPDDETGDFITSVIVGAETDNALLGGMAGGSLLGGMVGEALADADDSPAEFGGGSSDGGGAGGSWDSGSSDSGSYDASSD